MSIRIIKVLFTNNTNQHFHLPLLAPPHPQLIWEDVEKKKKLFSEEQRTVRATSG